MAQATQTGQGVLNHFLLAVTKLSRKNSNLNLSSRLLINQISDLNGKKFSNRLESDDSAHNLRQLLEIVTGPNGLGSMNKVIEVESELAKLAEAMSENRLDCLSIAASSIARHVEAFHQVSQTQQVSIAHFYPQTSIPINLLFSATHSTSPPSSVNDSGNEHCARSLLNLVKWLSKEQSILKEVNSLLRPASRNFDSPNPQLEKFVDDLSKVLNAKRAHTASEKTSFQFEIEKCKSK